MEYRADRKVDVGVTRMELNYFKDALFDLINDWKINVREILSDDKKNLFWVVMQDGSVFRVHCEKEDFNLFKPPKEV